jgi:hypothetical protein
MEIKDAGRVVAVSEGSLKVTSDINTLLLIIILAVLTGFAGSQMVFNYLSARDRQQLMDLQVISMVAGTTANTEQLMDIKFQYKDVLNKKSKGATK